MRVIIMETNGKEAVALNQDGSFVKVRNLGYSVGQELQIVPEMIIRESKSSHYRAVTKIAALAACFCILFASIFGLVILNSQSYGYVSVDVNPSIEFRINRFDRVVSVSAVNADGEAILATIGVDNLDGEDIEVALSLMVDALSVQGYLDRENAGLLISSTANSDKASAALNQKLLAYTAAEEKLKGVEVIAATVSYEMVEEAEKLGTTAGKLHLIQSISEDVDILEWIDKSVTEIYAAVQEHSSELPSTSTDPETDIELLPETTTEPDIVTEPVTEPATSEPAPETTVEPDVTTEEAEVPTEPETETEVSTEDQTWPETWPEESMEEWPEEWPEPETDDSGRVSWPENTPWWIKWLWWLFGNY